MAGLDPAIHVFLFLVSKDVDAQHKAGHDDSLILLVLLVDLTAVIIFIPLTPRKRGVQGDHTLTHSL